MFFQFGIKDFIDILLVATLLYYLYKLMKSTGSMKVFTGLLIFVLSWLVVTQVLEMRLLGSIFDKLISVGVWGKDKVSTHEDVLPIVMACLSMAKGKVGALIVMERNVPLDNIVRTGDTIDANVNQRLIENIFFKNSPLHDGAMVISNKRIKAAGCILPVSHDLDIPKELGLRHRAGMGISQETDAMAIIVSEETGSISVAYKGEFHLKLNAEELESLLISE